MARTPYATRTYDTPQKGPRVPNVSPSFIVIHHAATLDFDAVINLEMGAREVSSTVIIKDGQVASMFDEVYRAWSLSSQYWDSVSLSSETCNETTSPGWTISEASYATLAKVVADWCVRYGIACNRTQVLGHREVYTRYGASYATACPGGIDLDRVVRDAANIINNGGEYEMTAEQEAKLNAVYDALFKTSQIAGSTTGGNPMPGGLLRMASINYDATLQSTPTSVGTPGGTLPTLKAVLDKLEAIEQKLNQ